ncbi:MAG TPA: S8 family serine peptidase [Ideonella sp.]|nr:S8 family serine peptidase [Ideonella sp.]
MPTFHLGRKDEPASELKTSSDLIAVRTRSKQPVMRGGGPVAVPPPADLQDGALVLSYPDAGVEVFRVPVGRGKRSLQERKTALQAVPDVRFAGGVLVDPKSGEPVLYTENLFVKFVDTADAEACREVLRDAALAIKQEVSYATNGFFVEAPEGTGQKVFEIAQQLLARDDVEYCHPELIRPRARKAIFDTQWHLKKTTVNGVTVDAHANVAAAHQLTRGEGITIAVIDDGVDIDHPEFAGAGKVVAPRDATEQTGDPRPQGRGDNHGTACAGVAAANGTLGASGVAPAARLMPIRLASGLGSQREAEAFLWAAQHGADVISCSWGPQDGDWWNPADPVHQEVVGLPASTRLAIEHVITEGRGGKGCVVLFAAGNGNEPVDNDGYASNPNVIAVAACNDTGRRSVYSDFGDAVWCAFPSSDFGFADIQHPEPLTPGIWTVDRHGRDGYNAGSTADGDAAGQFTNSFGGTSSACPGAAGVAALVLAVNPELKWHEVKDLLKRAGDRIDPQGGAYDAQGHSALYGHGRLNARTAVELAAPQPRSEVTVSRRFDAPIPDLQTVEFALEVAESTPVQAVTVALELAHTYIGDLVVTLLPPAGAGASPIVLHNRTGGTRNSLKKVYDSANTRGLRALAGVDCSGTWTLRIRDAAAQDAGTLVGWGLRLQFAHADKAVSPKPAAPAKKPAARKATARRGANRAPAAKPARSRRTPSPA